MSQARYAGLFLIALAGCVEQNDVLTPTLVQNADLLEQDVLATAVPYLMGREPTRIDIIDSNVFWLNPEHDTATVEERDLRILADSMSLPDRDVIADFRRRNSGPGSVRMPLHMRDDYRWISADTVNPYRGSLDRPTIVGISHVGFSRDYRRALVYITYSCGSLCGAGNFVWLERDGTTNRWHVAHENLVWVS